MLAVYSKLYVRYRNTPFANCLPIVSLAMEAIGDITASAEVSRVAVDGLEFDSRIQGGVLVSPIVYEGYFRFSSFD